MQYSCDRSGVHYTLAPSVDVTGPVCEYIIHSSPCTAVLLARVRSNLWFRDERENSADIDLALLVTRGNSKQQCSWQEQ